MLLYYNNFETNISLHFEIRSIGPCPACPRCRLRVSQCSESLICSQTIEEFAAPVKEDFLRVTK